MKKIIIIGTTGSGKSTFAALLSKKLGYDHINLDQLFWKPNWQWSLDEEFHQKIRSSICIDNWIIDGNYTKTHSLTWSQADTIIWIDLPFWLTFYQCFTRALKRALSDKELWEGTGNKESLGRILSKDSILLWLIKTYKTNKRKYEVKMSDPRFSHITFYRLKSRKAIRKFLS